MSHKNFVLNVFTTISLALSLLSCSGGGGDDGRAGGSDTSNFGCDGSCANQVLSAAEVKTILGNAILGAQSVGAAATFAVVDRVGNVLAVYQMDGAPTTTTINGQIGAVGGLEGLSVPSSLAAISKAGTGAYLSSQGNAFSTRTASQIIQEHFNPGESNQPGGPLFGVQFSQLLCSDVTVRPSEIGGSIGPRPLPLGLSADPGGIPLYKQGDLVGGIGVEFDGAYRLDRLITDTDNDPEERVALIASRGFEAPSQRVAPNVNIGKSLRYTDIAYDELDALPEILPDVDSTKLIAVSDFSTATIKDGVTFGTAASGVATTVRAGIPAAVLVDGTGAPRFPTRAGSSLGGAGLNANEVDGLLDSSLLTAFRSRAAIRRPLDTPVRVTIWVVDNLGSPLGMVRSQDAPVFGIDVSLQKARAAAFFSSKDAAAVLSASGLGEYVAAAQSTLGANALTGANAFGNRSVGNLARPFFPDGIENKPNGPFSLPFPGLAPGKSWSPFNDGLQLDIVLGGLAQSLGLVPGGVPGSCASGPLASRAVGGVQIFAGAVPLYRRDGTLIGAIGVSGDGIDQDDLTAFYGASRPGLNFAGHPDLGDPELGFNAPKEMRADRIDFPGQVLRLRYVNCPEAPFSGSDEQNVCENL